MPVKKRKAREWEVVVSKLYGSMLMPHDTNKPCGDRKCCGYVLLREVLPTKKRRKP
jgi:hypothetical protein